MMIYVSGKHRDSIDLSWLEIFNCMSFNEQLFHKRMAKFIVTRKDFMHVTLNFFNLTAQLYKDC